MEVFVPTVHFAPEPRVLNFQLNPKNRFVEDQWLHASPGYLELTATVDKLEGTPATPAHATADLSGTVVAPLVGARVSIEDRAGKTVASTVSDAEGYYCLLLHDITSGFYTFTMESAQISSSPVVSKNWWLNPWTDELSDLKYSLTGPPTGVTGGSGRRSGAPPRPPQIYGTLLGPVKGALVTLRDQEGQITMRTHTDASGDYQFQSLPMDREFTVSAIDGERDKIQSVGLVPYTLNFEVDRKGNAMHLCYLAGCPGF